MTRKQRLLKKVSEIERELNALTAELEELTQKKKSQAKSAEEVELFTWIFDQYFNYDLEGITDREKVGNLCGKALHTLRTVVEFVEMKDPVKVVYQLMYDRDVLETFMDNKQFEKVQKFYNPCPSCGTWVERNAYKCSCGHHFKEHEWIAELTKPDGKIERYIKKEHGVEYEIVVDGVAHPAKWVLSPIDKELDKQNGGVADGEHIQKAEELT